MGSIFTIVTEKCCNWRYVRSISNCLQENKGKQYKEVNNASF